jgi:hypothetical protein
MGEKSKEPITKKDIPTNPDAKIDQDFPGYPHGAGKEEVIKPKNKKDHDTADTDNKDGEKINYKSDDEPEDDGSANAFERAEE